VSEYVWRTGEMSLTEKNQITRRKTCPSATFITTNPTWTKACDEIRAFEASNEADK